MIYRLWIIAGRVTYFICRPLIMLYVHKSHRTRVLVMHGEEVLMVKGWLGDGSWQLPGGGLRRSELPALGAARELEEETSIVTNYKQLQLLIDKQKIKYNGSTFYITGYLLKLKKKPKIKKQLIEIVQIGWVNYKDLLEQQPAGSDIRAIFAAFDN